MPSGVYSTHFVSAAVSSVATATAARYVVPAGKVVVVRSVDFYVAGAPGAVLACTDRLGGAPFASSQGLVNLDARHWEGRQVIEAGGWVGAVWISGVIIMTVNGYLFNAAS